jgi:hypothetical protein
MLQDLVVIHIGDGAGIDSDGKDGGGISTADDDVSAVEMLPASRRSAPATGASAALHIHSSQRMFVVLPTPPPLTRNKRIG